MQAAPNVTFIWQRNGQRCHMADGDGLVAKVSFRGGRAHYMAQYVKTHEFKKEEEFAEEGGTAEAEVREEDIRMPDGRRLDRTRHALVAFTDGGREDGPPERARTAAGMVVGVVDNDQMDTTGTIHFLRIILQLLYHRNTLRYLQCHHLET